MKLYKVEVTETNVYNIWVEAQDRNQAEEAAEELRHSLDPQDYDWDSWAMETTTLPKYGDIWVDGEDGHWLSPSQYKDRKTS